MKSFLAMDILERAQEMTRSGEDVISLSIGEPDFAPPECAKRACIEALQKDNTKYTHSQGLLEFREAIVHAYRQRYQVSVHPDQVIVTGGSSPAFFLAFAGLLNPGDEVILPDPYYPCYPNFIQLMGGKPVPVKVREREKFQYRSDRVKKKITSKTKAILVNSPSNPTGYRVPEEVLCELARLRPYLVSDEIYHGLVYEGKERSALEFTDRAFVINGFSKAYSMTGFRLGYLIAPKNFIRPLQKIQQSFYISVSPFVQAAGLAVLKEGKADQERMCRAFAERRQVALRALREIGLTPAFEPEGAFYIFISIQNFTHDSYHFAFDCLEKAKVGITPGIDFGAGGEGYIRISYANSVKNIREGIRRLGEYLEKNHSTKPLQKSPNHTSKTRSKKDAE